MSVPLLHSKFKPLPCSSWTLTLQHVSVSIVRDGVDVRRHLRPSPSLVHVHHLGGVDGEAPVRVHSYTEESGVSLDKSVKG